ncbi:GNAT family N-acetyltransferase [Bradyrhizobium cosmicum]|uniref:GNAT family N-acetyltransferase n=1 Tax=Bradyrhizobium cosmicum TaxID=1404864 RepID=UPI0028E1F229|nr:GNAT family N-acetyltransferase [Bradyrhizobium cosmicum]
MATAATQAGDRANEDVALIPFARAHLKGALKLSLEMSWPYLLKDWEFALQLGRGFVVTSAGAVVGTALCWPYGDTHASAGMIIVSKAVQGRGYGARLMDALLAAARPRIVTLNSTAEGLALYARRGFASIGMLHQHHGVPRQGRDMPPVGNVRAMVPSDFEAIVGLDHEATGWLRREMLNRLIELGDGYVLLRDGVPRGYSISRLFGRGHVIGPVVAESPTDARALIEAALAPLGSVFVRIDTSASSQLGDWLESIGLQQVSDATTMVLGAQTPSNGPARRFAVANQSFG